MADRQAHTDSYPELYYPEIYLLEKGYSNFWKEYPQLCTQGYIPMKHSQYKKQLKRYLQHTPRKVKDTRSEPKVERRAATKKLSF